MQTQIKLCCFKMCRFVIPMHILALYLFIITRFSSELTDKIAKMIQ